MTSEEEKAFPCSSAQRTFESSPALQRWENRINWFSKPAEGATETFRIKNQTTVCRPFHGLGTFYSDLEPSDESVGYFRSSATRTINALLLRSHLHRRAYRHRRHSSNCGGRSRLSGNRIPRLNLLHD